MYQPYPTDFNDLWSAICNDFRDWLSQHRVQTVRPNLFNQFLLLSSDGGFILIPGTNKWVNIYISRSGKITLWMSQQPQQFHLADPDHREKILNELQINLPQCIEEHRAGEGNCRQSPDDANRPPEEEIP